MRRYLIWLRIEPDAFPPKTAQKVIEEDLQRRIAEAKRQVWKDLDIHVKNKEIIPVKNDSPLPVIVCMIDPNKADDLKFDYLRKIDSIEMIEPDYNFK